MVVVKPYAGCRGIFLDLDGTLADSLGVLRKVYFRFLEEFGIKGSDSEFREMNGPKLAEIVSILRKRYDLTDDALDLLMVYNRLIDEAYQDAQPLSGARELLENAWKRGWTLVLVTSNLQVRAQAWLTKHGFSSLFHFIVSGEEVKRGKPFPDLYQLALSRSGCVTEESFAVEDSLQGAQAALGAGLRTFVIRSEFESEVLWPRETEFIGQWKELSSVI